MKLTRALSCGCAFALTAVLTAQDWPTWRGPNDDGSTSVTGLPTSFGPDENVRWKLALPGPGASTPIVVGNRVFLTSVDAERERLVALCVDRDRGDVTWSRDADSGYQPQDAGTRVQLGPRSNYASPSPAVGDDAVVFFFGNGDLVCYSFAGEERWRHNVQEEHGDFAFQWTFSASPTVFDGVVYLPVLQRDTPVAKNRSRRGGGRGRRGRGGQGQRRRRGGSIADLGGGAAVVAQDPAPAEAKPEPIESFLLAFDLETGKQLWKHVRPSPAVVESRESYTTMIPRQRADGSTELVLVGGDVLTGHDAKTGKELWRWGTWNEGHRERWWRIVPSVVLAGDVAVICAPKGAPMFGILLGGEGDLGDDAVLWQSEGRRSPLTSDVPTPAHHDGTLFVLSSLRKKLSRVKAADGEVEWTVPMPGDYIWRASPTVADGRVYCMNHGGEVVVFDAKSGEIVHETKLGSDDDDLIRSSIVASHGALFVRTNDALYCFGESAK